MKSVLLTIALTMASLASAAGPAETAEHVDLRRYAGRWYEIAAVPAPSEEGCVKGSRARYSLLDDGLLKVINSCRTEKGVRVAEGRARIADPKTNAKLEVTFARSGAEWSFAAAAEYWIASMAEDYSWAVVVSPGTPSAWILARRPKLESTTLFRLAEDLKERGYDTCKLLTTPQTDGFLQQMPLCEVVANVADLGALGEVLAAEPRFSKFAAAAAANAADILASRAPHTLLVPTDEAIAKLPAGQWDAVAASPTLARKFVLNHVVRGEFGFAKLRRSAAVETLFGSRFAIENRGADVRVGGVRVLDADRYARNGVIHAIETILPTPFIE